MDEKPLAVLEYGKVLERLAAYAAFSASAELALALHPSSDLAKIRITQARTSEARLLLNSQLDFTIGGVGDIRPQANLAERSGVLTPKELLDIKNTLARTRELIRVLEKGDQPFPTLMALFEGLTLPAGLIDLISQAISEHSEVLDRASDKLANLRREVRVAHDRLLGRLEKIINDPKSAPMLQEAIITQRGGRYVIPLRADFKGQIRAIVHDQSASGATLFIEPLVTVDLNNRWQELKLAERDEERRILTHLSAEVGNHAPALCQIVEAVAALDLALMCAHYAEDLNAVEPTLVPFNPSSENHPGSVIQLYQARHPLLDQAKAVAIDVLLDSATFSLIITGPNTGGKTVTLKTAGLLVLMAQTGLHIPAQSGSTLSIFQDVYADIGDEQSIEQSLSTFSGHITNIARILKKAGRNTLVLLDELGAGTDPQEGAALARSLLTYLVAQKITCLVATHYPELKVFAHSTPGVVNASMEFNLSTLLPTYHLTVGLPGRSNALLVAERLGLPKDIIEGARTTLDPSSLKAEDLLEEIHRQRDLAIQARSAAEFARKEIEKKQAEVNRRLEKMEDERVELLENARRQIENEMETLQNEIVGIRREMLRLRQPVEALKPLQDQVEEIKEVIQKPVRRRQVRPKTAQRPLRVGERVFLRTLKTDGVVTTLGEDEIEVQLGSLRLRARKEDILRKGEEEEINPAAQPAAVPNKSVSMERPALFNNSPGLELHLRGQRVEDALSGLDRYLESAYLAGLPFVRIIHGKGTGRLRQVVREALRESPHVASWETGLDTEGGDGVTIARLKT
jgi:DNA mismatch repair protein MutS2